MHRCRREFARLLLQGPAAHAPRTPSQPYYLAAPRDAEPASPACGSYEHAQAQCPSYPAEVQHQYPDVWYPAEDVYYVVDAAAAYGPEFSGQVLYVHPSSVYC